jgi:hypothetical protein
MAVTVKSLREGLVANLKTIPGLRVVPILPEQVNPPLAMVNLDRINYQKSFHRGLTEYLFKITVVVGRASERSAQNSLDQYVASDGVYSVLNALENDRTLGGVAADSTMVSLDAYGSVVIGDVNYLSAEFSVQVFAL